MFDASQIAALVYPLYYNGAYYIEGKIPHDSKLNIPAAAAIAHDSKLNIPAAATVIHDSKINIYLPASIPHDSLQVIRQPEQVTN